MSVNDDDDFLSDGSTRALLDNRCFSPGPITVLCPDGRASKCASFSISWGMKCGDEEIFQKIVRVGS